MDALRGPQPAPGQLVLRDGPRGAAAALDGGRARLRHRPARHRGDASSSSRTTAGCAPCASRRCFWRPEGDGRAGAGRRLLRPAARRGPTSSFRSPGAASSSCSSRGTAGTPRGASCATSRQGEAGPFVPHAPGRTGLRRALGDLELLGAHEVDLHRARVRGAQGLRDATPGLPRLPAVRRRKCGRPAFCGHALGARSPLEPRGRGRGPPGLHGGRVRGGGSGDRGLVPRARGAAGCPASRRPRAPGRSRPRRTGEAAARARHRRGTRGLERALLSRPLDPGAGPRPRRPRDAPRAGRGACAPARPAGHRGARRPLALGGGRAHDRPARPTHGAARPVPGAARPRMARRRAAKCALLVVEGVRRPLGGVGGGPLARLLELLLQDVLLVARLLRPSARTCRRARSFWDARGRRGRRSSSPAPSSCPPRRRRPSPGPPSGARRSRGR